MQNSSMYYVWPGRYHGSNTYLCFTRSAKESRLRWQTEKTWINNVFKSSWFLRLVSLEGTMDMRKSFLVLHRKDGYFKDILFSLIQTEPILERHNQPSQFHLSLVSALQFIWVSFKFLQCPFKVNDKIHHRWACFLPQNKTTVTADSLEVRHFDQKSDRGQ